jgi:hypothetical protein
MIPKWWETMLVTSGAAAIAAAWKNDHSHEAGKGGLGRSDGVKALSLTGLRAKFIIQRPAIR